MEGQAPGHWPRPGEGGDSCNSCLPDMPIPGVRGGGEVRRVPSGTLKMGNPLKQGAPLKGYCKHPSCSVNTKLEPSWSSPAGPSSAAGFPPILGAGGWGLGPGASRPRHAVPTPVPPQRPPAPPRRRQAEGTAHPDLGEARRERAARSLPGTHARRILAVLHLSPLRMSSDFRPAGRGPSGLDASIGPCPPPGPHGA